MRSVRITALRRTVYEDLTEKLENPLIDACSIVIGEKWISYDAKCPEGFAKAPGAHWNRL